MPIYLQLGPFTANNEINENKAIKGTSKDVRHINWMVVESCSLDPTLQTPGDVVRFTRVRDGSSAYLFNMTGPADGGGKLMALVDFVTPAIPTKRLTLYGVNLISYSSTPDPRIESFVLRYAAVLKNGMQAT